MSIWTLIRIQLIKWNNQLNFVEKFLLFILIVAFLFPLTLPNCYKFGYVEIQPPMLICPFNENINLIQNENGYFNNSNDIKLLIKNGGKYENNQCKDNSNDEKQNVAIIVPFRNRHEHLNIFLQHLHSFLLKQNQINYQIFIVEQSDNRSFNRAKLLNIGFLESIKLNNENNIQFNCFIFHDVDILPMNVQQIYSCTSRPKHLCSYLDKFRYVLIYPTLFGGIITIQKKQFLKINGFSNYFYGYGGEDDDLYKRCKNYFGYIERYSNQIAKCKMIKHQQQRKEQINVDRFQLLENALTRQSVDGLSSLINNQTYRLLSIESYPLYTKIRTEL